jgi:flagellum-specific peptidoglycan hydrolase FlgJ
MSIETKNFITKHANDVIKSVAGTNFFASLKMAQMIIESSGKDALGKFGIGKGLAVRKANNYFGIKASKAWKGEKIALSTPKDGKPINYFRVYPSTLDSLKDHTVFLLNNPRYTKNGVFKARTPQEQAKALQRSGYAESKTYDNALINLIKAYGLEQLDKNKTWSYSNVKNSSHTITNYNSNPTNQNTNPTIKRKNKTMRPYIILASSVLVIAGVYYYRDEIKSGFQKLNA